MTLSAKSKFYTLVGFQLLLLTSLIGYKQFTLLTGERILLETVPVDPRDMFRGDYVALSYKISRLNRFLLKPSETKLESGETVFVTLVRQGRFWGATSISREKPEAGQLFLKGKVREVSGYDLHLEYGIESYFVPEGKGMDLQRRAGHGLAVEVSVDRNGHAVIRGVSIN